ncbi:MAG: biopolymer transporter ExbD [Gammaproteobacteria bacterium]|nr:biopolymer transporter ExbD [Gammaproteobacteria bacterium]NIR31088.1 biopolymer transporter ExbD [Gammaproteobacteria bacterium]NIR98543.1 biopolymer transporter ExbD [Gammaproteobacteria bacterium]NIT64265.1 biopolymer transporter ExbD [Gammaproteobacteria bacterium]NIV21870.1 biopolymer transporter ExbD [Gammaproteobacteria bacterium]
MRRLHRRAAKQHQELNITAFMNLMVVLVPFLLLTATLSHIAVLDLNLPRDSEAAPQEGQEPELQLELIVREDALEVVDRQRGRLKRVPAGAGGHDLAAVREKLKEIKAAFPEVRNVTLLLEADVPYDTLIQVMDTARSYAVEENGRRVRAELFPEISIGDAPPAEPVEKG